MARKSKTQRREEQRKRQATIRVEAKKKCRPGRDDFARMLLWLMIRGAYAEAGRLRSKVPLDNLCRLLVDNLVRQGFDADEAEHVYTTLEDKYHTDTMPFLIKRHLEKAPQSSELACD